MRLGRTCNQACFLALGGALALAGCGQDGLRAQPEVATSHRAVFERVDDFGSNPGGLSMYRYVPANLPPNAPLVVALHACAQNATQYRNAGFDALADQHGFAVLYPEQSLFNNPFGCFNWAGEGTLVRDTSNLERGMGENQSIIQMIDTMVAEHGVDPNQVYMMGHSGGAAQVALMAAVWPDRMAGGGIIAGIPYRCTTELLEVNGCLSPGVDRTAQQWGDLARMGNPGYAGPWPKLSIWHGASDDIVVPRNQTELFEQFSNLYGVDATADRTSTIGSASVEDFEGPGGQVLLQTVTIPGFGHGTPVDPSDGCGATASYFIDGGICAAEELLRFWGVIGGGAGDTTPPTVDVTAPANGATVMGDVTVTLSAQDDTGVDRVEVFANGAPIGSLSAAPYELTWPTAGLAAGTYVLRAVAFDAAGNRGVDEDTEVAVQSGVVDTNPPTVQITSPADGAEIVRPTTIAVTAADDFGVSEVEILVDGARLGLVRAPPFEVTFDPSAVAEGSHTIAAQARDAAGNQGEAMITLTTTGGLVDAPPSVVFTYPSDGETVRGIIRVTAEATDDFGVTAVLLTIDGETAGTEVVPPYSFLVDTTRVSTGTHALTLTAFDGAMQAAVDRIEVTVEAVAPTPDADPDPEPTPMPDPDVDNDRWGCSSSGTSAEPPVTFAALALVMLAARRRRQ